MEKGTDHILISVKDKALKSWKTIAYRDVDIFVIAQHIARYRRMEKFKTDSKTRGTAYAKILCRRTQSACSCAFNSEAMDGRQAD